MAATPVRCAHPGVDGDSHLSFMFWEALPVSPATVTLPPLGPRGLNHPALHLAQNTNTDPTMQTRVLFFAPRAESE